MSLALAKWLLYTILVNWPESGPSGIDFDITGLDLNTNSLLSDLNARVYFPLKGLSGPSKTEWAGD